MRLIGNWNLLWAGEEVLAIETTKDCPSFYAETIVTADDRKENVYHTQFGYRNTKVPGMELTDKPGPVLMGAFCHHCKFLL